MEAANENDRKREEEERITSRRAAFIKQVSYVYYVSAHMHTHTSIPTHTNTYIQAHRHNTQTDRQTDRHTHTHTHTHTQMAERDKVVEARKNKQESPLVFSKVRIH